MKILAVIPARAGSKGIPNKNIRLLGSHPLVYYAINNAIKSRYITDVIITTDSQEVKIIAEQMGAKCKWRDSTLCGDEVTLDAVIYDAIPKNVEWDYVITMQPTSPTLSVDTLDKAIMYSFTNDLDTLISVVNAPHLSWREDQNGLKRPNYKERLNRQYLPPYYMETGAFVISKNEVINKNTRIGKKIDVFPLKEDESQDIDTFADLVNAEICMQKKSIGIYVNGNNQIGMGHVYRVLEIADEFYTKPDIYYDKNQTEKEVFGKTTHNLIPVDGIEDLFERCKDKGYNVFINDILSTSVNYMDKLKASIPKAKIINFEDDGGGARRSDLVINALYSNSDYQNVYAGEKYYVSGKLFMFYEPIKIKKTVKKVFVSFGGADPQNYSDRILKIISNNRYNDINFIVVLGRAKNNVEELMEYNKYENIDVLYDVYNMPELMSKCDMAITSRGRTGYELALLGIPTIAMAQNSREEKHTFVSNENGYTYIGLNPSDAVIKGNIDMYISLAEDDRKRFQNMLLSHNLRDGRKRVKNLINSIL